MKKTGIAALSTLVTALAVTLLPGTPAAADSRDGVGDFGEIVLYRHLNFGGEIFDDAFNNDTYIGDFFVNSNVGLNDQVTSVVNMDLDRRVQLYDYQFGSGPFMSALRFGQVVGAASWQYADISGNGFNDRLSSHYFIS